MTRHTVAAPWVGLIMLFASTAEAGPQRATKARAATARAPAARSGSDYGRHIKALRPTLKKLRGRFHVTVVRPFVVVGDGGRSQLRRYTGFIRWVTDELKRHYFSRDPSRILTVYLFKDRRSYMVNARRLTGERPDTPYGFYSSRFDALIMNIKTGGGTLSHELVHPFVEANFPDCPAWLNEGLGSLYEAVGRRKGKIWGFTNWRLPGLQRAIRKRAVPSFKHLTSRSQRQFYHQDRGTNYSQSRYLVYYLQRRGLLKGYYHRFLKNRRADPTGYKTLQRVLGEKDMAAFQRRWQAWVQGLRWR